MKQSKEIVIREETFGYTVFDKQKLRHRLVGRDELNVDLVTCEFLPLRADQEPLRTDILRAPIRTYIETTLGCNLRCRYCFNNSGRPRPNELTIGQMATALEHLREAGVLDVRFTGGEVTTRQDWFEILRSAKDLGFAVSCNTNAVFTDRTTPEKFAQLGLEQVTVSIDGNEEHHNLIRGKGAYQRAVSNFEEMYKLGVRLRLNTLVSKFSLGDVRPILDLAAKYADEINFFAIVFIGRGANLAPTDSVTAEEHLQMSREIESLKPSYSGLNILHFAQVTRNTSINTDANQRFGLDVGYPSGSTTFNLLSDGRYAFSGYVPYILPDCDLGNVTTTSLLDVWQRSPKLDAMRRDAKRLIFHCGRCDEFTGNRCQGAKYEIELDRLVHPERTNPWCVYGNGPSLLSLTRK